MLNGVNREIPDDLKVFVSSSDYKNHSRKLIEKKQKHSKVQFFDSYEHVFDFFNISNGATLSFHHHLRNGDKVLQNVSKVVKERDLKNLHYAPSSIFPSYTEMVDLIINKNITNIHTNYLNGDVAKIISQGYLDGQIIMNTHGGRARLIESGDLIIDVAFIACPTVDKRGNGYGAIGPNACGTLGYIIPDLEYAKKVVLVTDNLVDSLETFQLDGSYVDGVLVVDSIGDAGGIVSGTTQITKDPIGLKIAKDTSILLDKLNLIKDGFSMQTGAGKTSLAVVSQVEKIMREKNIKGSFASGGITKAYVDMLEAGLFENLYDVQCFDLEAVKSFNRNKNHLAMSSSKYGNPYEKDIIADKLDFVILGATEIDLNFNVNVTTDSMGYIIGGSGGHSDIAKGADVTIVISPLVKSRIPIVREEVFTVTTPGEDVDIFVTERGIAVNPKRIDLLEKLKDSKINILTMEELLNKTYEMIGVPSKVKKGEKIIGHVEYRDGTVIDLLRKVHDDYIR